jgi:alpha-1,2-mannosyltransferase
LDQGSNDRKRPPFVFWASLWGLGAATFVALIGIDYFLSAGRDVIGRDFMNLWLAGKLTLASRVPDIFDVATYQQAVIDFFGKALPLNYSYPPHALLLAIPFALMPYYVAFFVFSALGIVLFTLAARPYMPFPAVYAAFTPATLLCLWFGHYGLLLGALWLVFFRLFGTARAGLAAAVMTFKPHMGFLIALAALRNRQTMLWAVAGTLLLGAASLAAFGLQPWQRFFQDTTSAQADLLVRGTDGVFYYRMMPSAYVAYGRGLVGIVLHAVFAIAALWIVARSKLDPFVYATATFLILPYAFNYDMTVVCLGFAIMLYSRWGKLTMLERGIAAAAFLSPQLTFFVNFLVPPLLLAGLWLLSAKGSNAAEE